MSGNLGHSGGLQHLAKKRMGAMMAKMRTSDSILTLLETAQRQLLASLAKLRGRSSEIDRASALAHRSLAATFPHVPSLIEDRVPVANAVILNKDDMRELLAQFAVDILSLQTAELRSEVEQRLSLEMGARHGRLERR